MMFGVCVYCSAPIYVRTCKHAHMHASVGSGDKIVQYIRILLTGIRHVTVVQLMSGQLTNQMQAILKRH